MNAARGPAAAPGPTWTKARLERVMALRFGIGVHGGPDTAAAAEAMGVSRRTVQRWLHGRHGRSIAHIPPRRLAELLALLLPSEETRRKEAQQAQYAERAIANLGLPKRMGVKPAWERQRWLEAHLVVVLEVAVGPSKIRQLAVGRASLAKMGEFQRRGRVVDQTTVPTRFHATALTHRVLTDLGPWRFQAGPGQVLQGFTQAWLADAPATHLSSTADALQRAR